MGTAQAHRAVVIALAVLLAWAAPVTAQSTLPNALEILGARTIEIPSATPTGVVTLPPLAVRVLVSPAPDAVEVVDVAIDNRGGGPTSAFRVTLAPRGAAGTTAVIADLVTTVDLGKAVRSATYVTKLLPTRGGAVIGAPFELSFVRPAGGLQVASSPLRLEVTSAVPRRTAPKARPQQVGVYESTRVAGLGDLRAVATGALKGPGDAVVDADVEVKVPSSLLAGQAASVEVALTRRALPLGTSKGTVTLSSPNLAQPVVLAVEIVHRRWLGWLAVTLAAGMLTGALVRSFLETNEALVRARRDARQRVERLRRLAGQQVDPGLRKQLEDLATNLSDGIRDLTAPTDLDNAAKAAADAGDKVLTDAKKKHDELYGKLHTLRAKATTYDRLPAAVKTALEGVQRRVAQREAELKAGLLADVERDLTDLERDLPRLVLDALEPWRQAVLRLDEAGAWPGTAFGTAQKRAVDLATALGTEADPEAKLRKAAELGDVVHHDVFGSGLTAVAKTAADVASALAPEPAPVSTARATIEALRQADVPVDRVGDVATAVAALRSALRTALVEALRDAHPQSPPEGFDEALSAGRFSDAAKLLPKGEADPQSFDAFRAQAPDGVEIESDGRLLAVAGRVPAWTVTIQGPRDGEVGRDVVLVLQSSAPFPESAVARWSAGGRAIGNGEPGARIWHFTPREPGRTQIELVVTDDATGHRATAEAWIEVKPAEIEETAGELSSELLRWTIVRYAIIGAILVGAGVMIFKGAWVGTLEDVYPAFLWGFGVDIGAAKIRELSGPLLSKALPARTP